MGGKLNYICKSGWKYYRQIPQGGTKSPCRGKNSDQTEVSPPKNSATGPTVLISNKP